MKLTTLAALLGTTALIPVAAMAQSNTAASQPNADQQAQAQRQQGQATASQLRSQPIYTPSGREIGRVRSVVQGKDNQPHAVVAAGDREVLLPANRIAYQNNRFVASNYTDEQLRQLPAYDQRAAAQYREVDPNFRLAIVGYDVVAARRTADVSRILVQQPAPTVQVDQAAPQVTVQQPQPNVTVFQPQPEIIVRQPQPTLTVNIPKPEIIVRMPQPEVNVAMAQPEVRVNQPRPTVEVQQNQRQAQVQVERDPARVQVIPPQAQANVQVQRKAQEPQVRYQAAEPRVVVTREPGEPKVRFERMQGQDQQANAQAQQGAQAATVIAFADLDHDRNKTLSREEFNGFAGRAYSGWDANRDRRLERNEFYGGLYGLWDRDRDNRVTQAEYNEGWGTWGRGLERREFGSFDRNGDGFLDRQEFAGGWGENGLYDRWDADRGGWLAENEFGNGLFGLWGGERNEVAEHEVSPWLARHWGLPRASTADAGAATVRDPGSTGAVPAAGRDLRVTDVENMDVYNYRNEKLGEVKRLVRGIANNRQFVVLEHGGFLGLGEKEVPLPLDRFAVRGDRLYFRGLTEAELRQMPDWDMNTREYREFGDNETIRMSMAE